MSEIKEVEFANNLTLQIQSVAATLGVDIENPLSTKEVEVPTHLRIDQLRTEFTLFVRLVARQGDDKAILEYLPRREEVLRRALASAAFEEASRSTQVYTDGIPSQQRKNQALSTFAINILEPKSPPATDIHHPI